MFLKILKKIKPAKDEEKKTLVKVNNFLKKINGKLLNAGAVVGGSFAKSTWISGQHDIDIFVLFNNKENMSLRLEVVVKSLFDKYEKIHGSRDYFIVNYEGLSFELVPVLNIIIPEDAENITDISPMHVNWIKKNINDKLADDIRLAKEFMRANGCYGAETYIGGFSGYLVELLIIHYDGFMNFIKNASFWQSGTVIDIEKNNKFVSEQKFPLVVIDPVQPNRNVAAALRKEKFDLFVDLCKKFVRKRSDRFFKRKKINLKHYDLVFQITPLNGSKDVVGTKMLKAFEKINFVLNRLGFLAKYSGWFWDNYGYFYFKVKNKKLSKYEKHFGPPIKFTADVKKFKDKYKKYKLKEQDNKVFVILPRKITSLKEFARFIVKDTDITKRVKTISPKAI